MVLDALEAKLREMAAEGELPDVITFAGNGEPTAAPEFPQAIAGTVALRDELAPNSKIAVLSNGTRADRPQVHDALMMSTTTFLSSIPSTRRLSSCSTSLLAPTTQAPDRDVRKL